MYDYTQDNLSISTSCQTCLALDTKCEECLEISEARLSDKAHEIVDEGNLQYPRLWMINRPQPSGHDWTEREGEYKLPTVFLQDGGEYEELWELDDERQRAREVQCPWCNLLTPKLFNDCQDCDRPLEGNVR